MMYGGHGERLMLWLQESQTVQAVGSIATLQGPLVDEHSSTVFQEFDFKKTHVVNEVMVKPDALHAAFSELDWGASYARLLLSPDPPYFRLSCDSPAGSIEIELPSDAEIFGGMFSCKQTQTNKYKMALLQPAVKALQPATSAKILTNVAGCLKIQIVIHSEDNKNCFAEFMILPDEPGGMNNGYFTP